MGPSFWSRLNTIKRIRIIMPSLIRYVISCLKFLIIVQRTRLISPCARGVCVKKLLLQYFPSTFITVVTVSWISLRLISLNCTSLIRSFAERINNLYEKKKSVKISPHSKTIPAICSLKEKNQSTFSIPLFHVLSLFVISSRLTRKVDGNGTIGSSFKESSRQCDRDSVFV